MWNIDAPGILDVHAFLYFDGNALFVQSADPSNPAKGNGKAIGSTWQQMEIPCTIELGKARLVYRTLETEDDGDEDKTMMQQVAMPAPAPPGKPPFRPGAFAPKQDDESTQFAPIAGRGPAGPPPPPRGLGEPEPTIVAPLARDEAPRGGIGKPLPAAGAPAWQSPSGAGPSATLVAPIEMNGGGIPAPPQQQYQGYGSVQVATGAPQISMNMQQPMMQQPMMQQPHPGGAMQQPMQPMPGMMAANAGATVSIQTVPPSTLLERMKADWNATPPVKRVMLGMMPILFGLAVLMVHHQEELQAEQERARIEAQEQASASAAAHADKPPVVDPVAPSYTAPMLTAPTFTAPITGLTAAPTAPMPSGMGLMPTAMPTPAPTPTAPPTPSASASSKVPKLPPNTRTTERMAVDAIAGGDYKTAAGLYDQLAMAVPPPDPRHDTYAEAARIMHQKAAMSN